MHTQVPQRSGSRHVKLLILQDHSFTNVSNGLAGPPAWSQFLSDGPTRKGFDQDIDEIVDPWLHM